MGSDLSRPRNKTKRGLCNNKTGKQYSKSMVFDCIDLPEVMIKDQPCNQIPIQKNFYEGPHTVRIPSSDQLCYRQPRQSLAFDPIPTYIENTPPNRSRCSTPNYLDTPTLPHRTAKLCYATELPVEKSSRSSRIKNCLTNCKCCKRDDNIYNDKYETKEQLKRDPRQYVYASKAYQPVVYENIEKPNKVLQQQQGDFEIVPSERVYEIRKEKLLIKTDRNSQSPPRVRARSTDRYLDLPKNSRIIDDGYTNGDKYVYASESSDIKRQLQSRSGYYITESKEDDTERYNDYVDRRIILNESRGTKKKILRDDYELRSPSSANLNNTSYANGTVNSNNYQRASNNNLSYNAANSSNNISSNAERSNNNNAKQIPPSIVNVVNGGNEIVYVPMVKDEFIKRESQKLEKNSSEDDNHLLTMMTNKLVPMENLDQQPHPQTQQQPQSPQSSLDRNQQLKDEKKHQQNIKFQKLRPSKIIISELSPSNTSTKIINGTLKLNGRVLISQDEATNVEHTTTTTCRINNERETTFQPSTPNTSVQSHQRIPIHIEGNSTFNNLINSSNPTTSSSDDSKTLSSLDSTKFFSNGNPTNSNGSKNQRSQMYSAKKYYTTFDSTILCNDDTLNCTTFNMIDGVLKKVSMTENEIEKLARI